MQCPTQDFLDEIFPPERTDAFFDALYGGAEEGAYTIRLVCKNATPERANLAFELNRRPGQCLKCSLTYGLPAVFQRHPILNLPGVARAIGDKLGYGEKISWQVQPVVEVSDDLHIIPFCVSKG